MITPLIHWFWPYNKEKKKPRWGTLLQVALQNDVDFAFDWVFFSSVEVDVMYCVRNNRKCSSDDKLRIIQLTFCIIGTISWLMIASDGRLLAFMLRILGVPKFSMAHMLVFAILFEDVPQIVLSAIIDIRDEKVSTLGIANIMTSSYSIVGRIAELWDSFGDNTYDSGLGYEKVYNHRGGRVYAVERIDINSFLTGCGDRKIRLWTTDTAEKCARTYGDDEDGDDEDGDDEDGDDEDGDDEDGDDEDGDDEDGDDEDGDDEDGDDENVHRGRVNALAMVGPDKFLSGSSDSKIKLWHVKPPESQGGTCFIRTFNGHSASVMSVAVINKNEFVSGSHDKTAKLWNIDSGECLKTFDLAGHVRAVTKVSDATFLTLAVSKDQCVKLWSVDNARESITAFGGMFIPGLVAQGSILALDERNFVVGIRYGWTLWELDSESSKCIAAQSFGQWAGNNVPKAYILLWPLVVALEIVNGILFFKLFRSLSDQITSMAIVDEDTIATVSGNGTVRVLNVWTGECIHRFSGGKEGIVPKTSIVPLEAHKFVTGSLDRTAKLWTTQLPGDSRSPWKKQFRHEARVMVVKQVDEHRFLTGCSDNKAKLWHAFTGQCEVTYARHDGFVCAIAILPDEDGFLTGSSDSNIMLWDIEPQTEGSNEGFRVRTYTGHEGTVASIACIDAATFVSGSHDKTAKLWDITTGACLTTFRHGQTMKDRVVSVAKIGEMAFLTTCVDQSVRIWNTKQDTTPTFEKAGDLVFSPFLSYSSCSENMGVGPTVSLGPGDTRFLVGCRNGAELWSSDANESWRREKKFMPALLNFHLSDKVFICLGVLGALACWLYYWPYYVAFGYEEMPDFAVWYAADTVGVFLVPITTVIYIGFWFYSKMALATDEAGTFVNIALALPLVGLTQSFALQFIITLCSWYSYSTTVNGTFYEVYSYSTSCLFYSTTICEATATEWVGAGCEENEVKITILICDIIAALLLVRLHYMWVSKIGNLWRKSIIAAAIMLSIAATFARKVPISSLDVLVGSFLILGSWYYFSWYSKSAIRLACITAILLLLAASYVPPPWVVFTPFDVLVSAQIIGFAYFWTVRMERKWVGTFIIGTVLVTICAFHVCSSVLYPRYETWEQETPDRPFFKVSLPGTVILGMTLTALHWFFVSSTWLDWVTAITVADENTFLMVSRSGSVRIWNINEGNCVHHIPGNGIPKTSVVASMDGHGACWFLVGSWNHTVKAAKWDPTEDLNAGQNFQSARSVIEPQSGDPKSTAKQWSGCADIWPPQETRASF